MHKRFTGLVIALAGLLFIGGCDGWMLSGCHLQPKCRFEKYAEVASPGGSYYAISGVTLCSYREAMTSALTSVVVTGLADGNERGEPEDGAPTGVTVFHVFGAVGKDGKPQVPAADIEVQWRGYSELVVTYPPGIRFTCDPPQEAGTVHCVEHGFATSAPPRSLR